MSVFKSTDDLCKPSLTLVELPAYLENSCRCVITGCTAFNCDLFLALCPRNNEFTRTRVGCMC